MTEFKGLVKSLIWQGKRCLFQYDKLILPYEHGGLKLVDLDFKDISLKAAWILRVLTSDNLHYWINQTCTGSIEASWRM